ncbi:MAG: hypothetical protein H0V56_04825 [Chthoniobacterales bacterium]|nr:hypothetical protein [Chthoniobacterales bacterium]
MSTPAATPTGYVPIFDWDAPSGRKVLLGSLIVASTVLHALCFYLFQIIYPPTVALLPPPARVSIINGETEEGRLLLRWIEAEDPALASTTQRPPDAQLAPPSPRHVPSYHARQPVLKEPPRPLPDLRVPSPQPPAAVPLPRTAAPTPALVAPTTLTFAMEPEAMGAPSIPALQFTASTKELPVAALFRVAIGPGGEVRHCFLQQSSGDAALDDQARRHILLCRFPVIGRRQTTGQAAQTGDRSVATPLLWGIAMVQWGSDINAPGSDAVPTSPVP